MADAVSPKETELRQEFENWWAANCYGFIPSQQARSAYLAGFEAGERKERERCAKLLDEEVKHSAYAAQLQAVIRGVTHGN